MDLEDSEMPEGPAEFVSPYRITHEAWQGLLKEFGVPPGGGPVAKKTARRVQSARGPGASPEAEGETAWKIALRVAGRLGPELGDGKAALLCPWNDEHSNPDESAETAGGSCALLPPTADDPYGRPYCSHGHCKGRSLHDWAVAIGVDLYADATVRAKGWRAAAGYLAHGNGVSTAKKKLINLPRGDGERGESDPDEALPYTWVPGEALANFDARITGTVFESDGQGAARVFYEITARVRGEDRTIRVPAGEFNSLGWVAQQLGADAIIEPGRDTKDRLRAAIQHCSFPIPSRRVYTFIGWETIEGREVFLHGRGAIDQNGQAVGVETRFGPEDGPLAKFWLPAPLTGPALKEGIKACASLFNVGFPDVSMPLFAAVWRAPLGRSKLAPYLSAPMKSGKSLFAGLAQSHFGPEWNGDELPITLKSDTTKAAIGYVLAKAGDVLVIGDDYLLSGNPLEDAKVNDKVSAMVRNVTEGAGTLRMDGSTLGLRAQPPPRCLTALNGELLPRGHSLRSRMLVLQMPGRCPDELGREVELAKGGLYAATMAGYIQWLAPRIRGIRAGIAAERDAVAKKLKAEDPRVAKILAEVFLGVKYFAEFARAHDALSEADVDQMRQRLLTVLRTVGAAQVISQREQDPVIRFIELLSEVLLGGRGHLTLFRGAAPKNCYAWGWGPRSNVMTGPPPGAGDDGVEAEPVYEPRGEHLGYIGGGRVWIFASAAYAAVQRLATAMGDPIQIGRDDICKRLYDMKLIAKDEWNTRKTYTTRKRIGGKLVGGLLCLATETLRAKGGSEEAENVAAVAEEEDEPDTGEMN